MVIVLALVVDIMIAILQIIAGTLITLAFNVQVIEEVPRETHDIPVDLILTEVQRIDCKMNRKESSI